MLLLHLLVLQVIVTGAIQLLCQGRRISIICVRVGCLCYRMYAAKLPRVRSRSRAVHQRCTRRHLRLVDDDPFVPLHTIVRAKLYTTESVADGGDESGLVLPRGAGCLRGRLLLFLLLYLPPLLLRRSGPRLARRPAGLMRWRIRALQSHPIHQLSFLGGRGRWSRFYPRRGDGFACLL